MIVTAKDGGCPVHVPPHKHHPGMNECSICDEGVPCGNCGHPHLHGSMGCWGCIEAKVAVICMKEVRPACTCDQKTREAREAREKADAERAKRTEWKRKQCPKCGYWSGDDWRQCKGSCPMEGSPYYNLEAWLKYHPDPEHLLP